MNKPYLIWLAIFVWLPTLVLWVAFHDLLSRYPRTYLRAVAGAFTVGVLWDVTAVRNNIWGFPDGCCIQPRPGLLPWEEYMFIIFVCIYFVTIILILRDRFQRHRRAVR